MQTLIPLFIAIAAGAVGNTLIRAGMEYVPSEGFDFSIILKILSQPMVLVGILFLTGSFPFYSMAIQRLGLTVGMPLIFSSTIIITTIAAFFIFRESLTLVNIIGILLLISGIFLVTYK
ncbi:EamA family transporter [Candidatus Uhrbacteria bacterium]|nr:EamA family transporter [Candidatus Uhrbacteria bacterium]